MRGGEVTEIRANRRRSWRRARRDEDANDVVLVTEGHEGSRPALNPSFRVLDRVGRGAVAEADEALVGRDVAGGSRVYLRLQGGSCRPCRLGPLRRATGRLCAYARLTSLARAAAADQQRRSEYEYQNTDRHRYRSSRWLPERLLNAYAGRPPEQDLPRPPLWTTSRSSPSDASSTTTAIVKSSGSVVASLSERSRARRAKSHPGGRRIPLGTIRPSPCPSAT